MHKQKNNTTHQMRHAKEDCVMMKDGTMMMKKGKMMEMENDVTMKNCRVCMKDGTCKMKNGKTVMMKTVINVTWMVE